MQFIQTCRLLLCVALFSFGLAACRTAPATTGPAGGKGPIKPNEGVPVRIAIADPQSILAGDGTDIGITLDPQNNTDGTLVRLTYTNASALRSAPEWTYVVNGRSVSSLPLVSKLSVTTSTTVTVRVQAVKSVLDPTQTKGTAATATFVIHPRP